MISPPLDLHSQFPHVINIYLYVPLSEVNGIDLLDFYPKKVSWSYIFVSKDKRKRVFVKHLEYVLYTTVLFE